jgi:hypothetical protein
MKPRLLADENTSHHLISACRRLRADFPIEHIATARVRWLGMNDDDLLDACLPAGCVLVAHDRRTLADAAGRASRYRSGHAGLILFRRFIRQSDFGAQSRALCKLWNEAASWDWRNRIVYIPIKTPTL